MIFALNASFTFILLSNVAEAKIPYRVTIVDPTGALGSDRQLFLDNLDAAVQDWAKWVSSKGELWIEVEVDANNVRFGAKSNSQIFSKHDIYDIYELSGPYKMRTGKSVDENLADILIVINPQFMRDELFMDPNPKTRTTPVPSGKRDLVGILAHELGHGFGIHGFRMKDTGWVSSTDNRITTFDTFIRFFSDEPVFCGRAVILVYGNCAPLTFFDREVERREIVHDGIKYSAHLGPEQNLYHIGRFDVQEPESDLSFFSIMAGAAEFAEPRENLPGIRSYVNALDSAILHDLGVPPTP